MGGYAPPGISNYLLSTFTVIKAYADEMEQKRFPQEYECRNHGSNGCWCAYNKYVNIL